VLVFAGAVERFIEPFAHWLPGAKTKNEYENTVAAMTNGHPAVSLREVAAAKARQDRAQANRTVLLWGLATGIAAAVTGASGFYLLHMIAAADWAVDIPLWVDAMVTGLVVGTGTKPLHDLITRAQSGKD
jgi:Na+/glutamate symporter